MVRGIDSFRDWFADFSENYVLIGGTACDILLSEAVEVFRATRDIDMVLIAESMDSQFGFRIWEYLRTAGYTQRLKSSGTPEYYRFINPKTSEYPTMIELFSRRVDGIMLPPDAVLTPLQIDDEVSSLSAILLDDDYYEFLKSGVTLADGISVMAASHLIPFKAKAWLDLTKRKAEGEHVDSKNIKKHKNDIIRLSALLSPDQKFTLPATVVSDMKAFLKDVGEVESFSRTALSYEL